MPPPPVTSLRHVRSTGMQAFYWKLASLFSLMVLIFFMGTTVVTILLLEEVKDDRIDWQKFDYVRIAQYITAGLLGLVALVTIIGYPLWQRANQFWTQSISQLGRQLAV